MGKKKKVMYSVMSFRYGLTNGFSTLITTMASTYWAIFLTDAVGLETAVMAGILSAASIVDMVSVPFIGIIMQKAKFKSGKFRPWLILGAVTAAVFRWLTFTDPGLTGAAQAVWFGGGYILTYIGYNIAFTAFTGLLPLMATDPDDRQAYAGAKSICNSAGKFVFSLFSVSLVAAFGRGNDALGYSMLALLIGVLVIIAYFQLFTAVKKIDVVQPEAQREDVASAKPAAGDAYKASLWEMIKFAITKPFLLYLGGASCKGSTYFIITGLAAYYYTYVVGDKNMLTVYLSLSTFLMIFGSFIMPFISRLVKGAKQTYILGLALYAACLALAYFLGQDAIVFTVLMSAGYVGYSIAHAAEITVYSSVVDYSQWKSGKDLKPFMMSLFNLVPKIGTTVGSLVMGYGLVAVGFDAENVTAGAVEGIRILFSALPCILLIVGILLMVVFPLTDDRVRKMQAEIKARKSGTN